ncbi:MAG: peptide-methionine (S)-S-oxide reductase MsrA [Longimicrobiaceae bacterium]
MDREQRSGGQTGPLEVAVLGGGCFWCLEAAFQQLGGVRVVESGYAGGHAENPSYREVCSGLTGHAEVVRVLFDADEVSYQDLLEVFFTIHDPTTANRQGADVGSQYRSLILYACSEQKELAEAVIAQLQADGVFGAPIVSEVAPLESFYPAEEEHRDYYRNNPDRGYCRLVIAPKLAKLREKHRDRLVAGAT